MPALGSPPSFPSSFASSRKRTTISSMQSISNLAADHTLHALLAPAMPVATRLDAPHPPTPRSSLGSPPHLPSSSSSSSSSSSPKAPATPYTALHALTSSPALASLPLTASPLPFLALHPPALHVLAALLPRCVPVPGTPAASVPSALPHALAAHILYAAARGAALPFHTLVVSPTAHPRTSAPPIPAAAPAAARRETAARRFVASATAIPPAITVRDRRALDAAAVTSGAAAVTAFDPAGGPLVRSGIGMGLGGTNAAAAGGAGAAGSTGAFGAASGGFAHSRRHTVASSNAATAQLQRIALCAAFAAMYSTITALIGIDGLSAVASLHLAPADAVDEHLDDAPAFADNSDMGETAAVGRHSRGDIAKDATSHARRALRPTSVDASRNNGAAGGGMAGLRHSARFGSPAAAPPPLPVDSMHSTYTTSPFDAASSPLRRLRGGGGGGMSGSRGISAGGSAADNISFKSTGGSSEGLGLPSMNGAFPGSRVKKSWFAGRVQSLRERRERGRKNARLRSAARLVRSTEEVWLGGVPASPHEQELFLESLCGFVPEYLRQVRNPSDRRSFALAIAFLCGAPEAGITGGHSGYRMGGAGQSGDAGGSGEKGAAFITPATRMFMSYVIARKSENPVLSAHAAFLAVRFGATAMHLQVACDFELLCEIQAEYGRLRRAAAMRSARRKSTSSTVTSNSSGPAASHRSSQTPRLRAALSGAGPGPGAAVVGFPHDVSGASQLAPARAASTASSAGGHVVPPAPIPPHDKYASLANDDVDLCEPEPFQYLGTVDDDSSDSECEAYSLGAGGRRRERHGESTLERDDEQEGSVSKKPSKASARRNRALGKPGGFLIGRRQHRQAAKSFSMQDGPDQLEEADAELPGMIALEELDAPPAFDPQLSLSPRERGGNSEAQRAAERLGQSAYMLHSHADAFVGSANAEGFAGAVAAERTMAVEDRDHNDVDVEDGDDDDDDDDYDLVNHIDSDPESDDSERARLSDPETSSLEWLGRLSGTSSANSSVRRSERLDSVMWLFTERDVTLLLFAHAAVNSALRSTREGADAAGRMVLSAPSVHTIVQLLPPAVVVEAVMIIAVHMLLQVFTTVYPYRSGALEHVVRRFVQGPMGHELNVRDIGQRRPTRMDSDIGTGATNTALRQASYMPRRMMSFQ